MKTEKRPAREGERILIVDAFFPIGYKNGDVLTVIYCSLANSSVVAMTKRRGAVLVYGKEYKVVVEDVEQDTDKPVVDGDDAVAHPSHYTSGKFEVIEVIEEFTQGYNPYEAYCVGNVIKYVARAPHKHSTPLQDLKKARQYLDFAIKRIEAEEE